MKKFIALFVALMFVFTFSTVAIASSSSDADAIVENVEAGALIDQSGQDNRVYNRNFVIPGNTPLPQTNGFFTAPTPDSSFRSITELFENDGSSISVTEGALESMAKGGNVDLHLQLIKGPDQTPRVFVKDENGDRWLTITYHKPVYTVVNGKKVLKYVIKPEGLTRTGFIDGEADNGDTNSLQVIGKCGLKALKDGDTHMVITAEGAHRAVEASGWGIGFYTVGGDISDNGKTAGSLGGGTGYASNETGTEDRPWIQGYVGVQE